MCVTKLPDIIDRFNRYGYERQLLEILEQLVKDMDRKIERQKERAVKESAPRMLTSADKAKLDELLTQQRGLQPVKGTAACLPQRA